MNALTDHKTRTAVSMTGLRKAYGEKVVLDGVDLTIGEGEVFALLGPNGAGKTTIVRILSTLISADAGTATVMGYDLRSEAGAARSVIGVTGQFSAVDNLLTGEENLLLMGRLLHLPANERRARASELLERFDLVEAARQTPATYSGGMTRRLDIAMTLMGRPRLIFLDEPTAGLDPRSRHTTWQLIRDLVAQGVTILLTTQYLEEADQLADRIAVLDRGRIVAEGTPEDLKRRVPGAHIASPMPPRSTRPPERCPRAPATTRSWRCGYRTRAASPRCATCSPDSATASPWTTCPFTRQTLTTCSSP